MTPRKVVFADGLMTTPPIGRGAEQLGRDMARRRDLFEILPPGAAPASLDRGTVVALGAQTIEAAAAAIPRLRAIEGMLPFLRTAGHLVLAGQGEGREVWPQGVRRLHAALARVGLDPDRVTLLQQSACYAEAYGAWCGAHAAGRPIGVLVWHHHLNEVAQQFACSWTDPAWRSEREAAVEQLRLGDVPLRLACLVNKLRAHRTIMLGRIFRMGWDRSALVSCAGARTRGELALAWHGSTAPGGGRPTDFAADVAAFEAVAPRLPLVIGEDRAGNRVFGDQLPIYAKVGFALIAESEMGRDIRRFTEKTVKAILCGRPIVVGGNPGTLSDLRALGFETFGAMVDEGYDTILDPGERLAAVLEEAGRLMGLSPQDWQKALRDVAEVAGHNLRVAGERLVPRLDAMFGAVSGQLSARIEAAG